MNKLILTCILLFTALAAPAQTSTSAQEPRQPIDIDYSMPDFSTSKIDCKVIGVRLAKMLKLLLDNESDFYYHNCVSHIQQDQLEGLDFVMVESFKVINISKKGDVITILFKTKLKPNKKQIKKSQIQISFDKGYSDNQTAQDLFFTLGGYIDK